MSLRDFLDAAYALLVRENLRRGADVFEALERVAPFSAISLGREDSALDRAERARLREEEKAMRRLEAAMRRAGMPTLG